LEQPFVRNAERRLSEAGGPGGDPAQGTARKLVIVPGVEHMSILFAPATHAAIIHWLDATFGPQPGAVPYTDRRMMWYGVGLLGTLLLATSLAPLVRDPPVAPSPERPLWWRLGAVGGGALSSTLILWAMSTAGLRFRSLLGLQIGGYVLLWLGLAGSISLLLLWARPPLPSRRVMLGGLLIFVALWLGVGALAQWVWYPWFLIWRRLRLWPTATVMLLPWFLAVGKVTRGEGVAVQAGRWLAHSLVLLGGLWLAVRLSPELGFLTLITPAFPVILGCHALAAAPHRGEWAFALSGALFTGWAILAVFPLH
jgi:hypothetical protein